MTMSVRCHRLRSCARYAITALLLAVGAMTIAGCDGTMTMPSVTETSWSPDSKTIAYLGDEGKLCLYDVETKQSRPVSSEETSPFLPAYSPDGKTIAFYAATGDEPVTSLRVLDLDSQQVRTLVPDVWPVAEEPTPQAGDQEKAFAERRSDLDLAAPFAGGMVGLIYAGAITWSPDGKSLVSVAASKDRGRLLLVDPAAGTAKPIVEEPYLLAAPAWSPDGARVAYVRWGDPPDTESQQGKQTEETSVPFFALCVYDFASGTASKVCDLPEPGFLFGSRLQWSADSRTLGFIAEDPAYSERAVGCLAEARAGAAMRQPVRGITPTAAWAPDLKGIAFVEERGEANSVVLYKGVSPPARRVLGSLRHPVTTETEEPVEGGGTEPVSHSTYISLPQFSPDGRLVCVALRDTSEKVTPQLYPAP